MWLDFGVGGGGGRVWELVLVALVLRMLAYQEVPENMSCFKFHGTDAASLMLKVRRPSRSFSREKTEMMEFL